MATKKSRFAALSISLPRPLRSYVEQRVRRGGFGNVSEYIRVLIRKDQQDPEVLAPARPMPGVAEASRPLPPTEVREGKRLEDVVDLSTDEWRELRAALERGSQLLLAARARDAADLFRSALETTRVRLRREDPKATEEMITMRVAAWLHDCAVPPDHPWRPVSRARWRRVTGG
jgi:antitoxin ParD1/3/4